MTPGPRRLYAPTPATVRAGPTGRPQAVDEVEVVAVREEWTVEDRWWLPRKLQRRYFELALVDGRSVVVFRCASSGRWYRQRA